MPVINGTNVGETLSGTPGDDTIDGAGGNDSIKASAGHDSISGGTGNDHLVVTAGDTTLFPAIATAASYTITASGAASAELGLDTVFTSVEVIDLVDARDGDSTLNAAGFGGRLRAVLGNGDHTVTGGTGGGHVTLGLGSSTVDLGSGGSNVAILNVDSSADAPVIVTGAGGTVLITYSSGGALQQTTVTNARTVLQSGVGHGLFVDGSDAPETTVVGYVSGPDGPIPLYSYVGVSLVDSLYDDVAIGSAHDDWFASAFDGTETVNGGSDTLLGNGGQDLYDYELALAMFRGDHLLDFDADDVLSTTYYDGTPGIEPSFIGTAAFTGTAHQIRYEAHDGKTYVEADVDGDGVADGTVVIESGEYALVGTDPNELGSNAVLRLAISQTMVSGTAGAERVNGTAGADAIRAGAGADRVFAGAGQDLIDGGKGADTLYGGTGDDTYIVDQTADRVVENLGEGADNVLASASFTLTANVERLTLTGTGDLTGTGNALDNAIWGNLGANVLNGAGGSDTLRGGAGDDVYYVDVAGDLVIEAAMPGGTRSARAPTTR